MYSRVVWYSPVVVAQSLCGSPMILQLMTTGFDPYEDRYNESHYTSDNCWSFCGHMSCTLEPCDQNTMDKIIGMHWRDTTLVFSCYSPNKIPSIVHNSIEFQKCSFCFQWNM